MLMNEVFPYFPFVIQCLPTVSLTSTDFCVVELWTKNWMIFWGAAAVGSLMCCLPCPLQRTFFFVIVKENMKFARGNRTHWKNFVKLVLLDQIDLIEIPGNFKRTTQHFIYKSVSFVWLGVSKYIHADQRSKNNKYIFNSSFSSPLVFQSSHSQFPCCICKVNVTISPLQCQCICSNKIHSLSWLLLTCYSN